MQKTLEHVGCRFRTIRSFDQYPPGKAGFQGARFLAYQDQSVEFRREDRRSFISPSPGEALDWVLVLDDASKDYPAPGTR